MYVAVITASAQKDSGIFAVKSIARMDSLRVLFKRSATSFDCGECGGVF